MRTADRRPQEVVVVLKVEHSLRQLDAAYKYVDLHTPRAAAKKRQEKKTKRARQKATLAPPMCIIHRNNQPRSLF